MDLFSFEAGRRICIDNVLQKIDTLLDWRQISGLLRKGLKRSGIGLQGYEPVVLFRCLPLGQWAWAE